MNRQIFDRGIKALGLTASDGQREMFEKYLSLLLSYNEKVNLTAVTDPDEAVVKHFLDSLTLLSLIDIPEGAKMIDVGSGAGFPGIPIKIMRPDMSVTLLDSSGKRTEFMSLALRELGLSGEVVTARAEEAGKDPARREAYDICVSRAVTRLAGLVELCAPLVKTGGRVAALKGRGGSEEAAEAKKAFGILGMGEPSVIDAFVPESDLEHTVVTAVKIKKTDAKYPRAWGQILKKPL